VKNKIDPKDPKVIEAGIVDGLKGLVKDLTDRELSNSRNMSKVIGQKIKFRDAKGKKPVAKEDEEANDDEEDDENDEVKSTGLEKFRNTERKKAINKIIPGIVKEFKDEDLDFETVYNEIDEYYSEDDDDQRREDFELRLDKAFRAAYPKLYEERIKRAAAKNGPSDSPLIGGGSHGHKKETKQTSLKSRGGTRKIKNLADWMKGE